ncbi:MAG: hypothetical protein ACOYBW_01215 [Fluviibacter phosphoraccumulans]
MFFFKKKPNLKEIHATISNVPEVMLFGVVLNRDRIIRENCFNVSYDDAEFSGYAVSSVLYILGFLCMSAMANSIKNDEARKEISKTLVDTLFTNEIAERLGYKDVTLLADLTSIISDKIKNFPEPVSAGLQRYSIAGYQFLKDSLPFELQAQQESFIKKIIDEFVMQSCTQFQADVLNINR